MCLHATDRLKAGLPAPGLVLPLLSMSHRGSRLASLHLMSLSQNGSRYAPMPCRDYEAIAQDFVTLQFMDKGTDLRPIMPVLAKVS